jgi:hypothetical protein
MRLPRALVILSCVVGPASAQRGLDTASIEKLTGLKGTLNKEEGVFKVTSPRSDVAVAVDRWAMPPFMGLTSWAAFQPGKKAEAMVMGDLVLFEDEVNPVMSACLDAGLSVTALHNHFFFDDPRVFFMHIAGEGTQDALAGAVGKAMAKVKEIRAASATPARSFGGKELPAKSSITPAPIEELLGAKGQGKDGMVKVTIGRKVRAACGCEVGKDMGVNTWAAFAGSDESAVVDGDFAVLEEELQGVLRTLRKNGIDVVAIHHHMTHETPRMLFLHYWGRGRAADLARALKAALELLGK